MDDMDSWLDEMIQAPPCNGAEYGWTVMKLDGLEPGGLTLWCKAAYVVVDVPCQIRSKMMSKCGNLLAYNPVYGVSLNLRFRCSRRYADSERAPQVEMLKLQRKDGFNMITPFFYVDLFEMFRSCSFYHSWYVSTSLHIFYCQYSLPFTCGEHELGQSRG